MKDSDWRYLVDVVLFVCLGGMTLIGILLGLVIPAGPASSEASKYFLGLHRHQWGNVHAYLSIAFVVLTIVHIVFNWKWVTAKTSQIFKKRPAPILVAAASVPFLVLLVFWLFTPKDAGKYKGYGIESSERGSLQKMVTVEKVPVAGETAGTREMPVSEKSLVEMKDRKDAPEEKHRQAVGSLDITGRNTLLDIERATGISGRVIAEKLGLPPQTDLNETLGRLRRLHRFEIQEVRDLVDKLLKQKEN
jgi:hypothetical protein